MNKLHQLFQVIHELANRDVPAKWVIGGALVLSLIIFILILAILMLDHENRRISVFLTERYDKARGVFILFPPQGVRANRRAAL